MANARYRATPPTANDGDLTDILTDSAGRPIVVTSGGAAENGAATGNPVLMGVRYDSSPRTLDSGDVGAAAADVNSNLIVNPMKLDPINDGVTTYANGNYVTAISTAATTLVAAFPIYVEEIRVLGGTLGNVSVYDNTTASGSNPIPAFTPDKGQVLIGKSTIFGVGCTVVTAAATIMTVTWRPQ